MDLSTVDQTADRCGDFYRYACGSWLDATAVPSAAGHVERARAAIDGRTEAIFRELLSRPAGDCEGSSAECNHDLQRLQAFRNACLTAGPVDLESWFERLASAVPLEQLLFEVHEVGVHAFFRYEGVPDPADPKAHRGQLGQGRLVVGPDVTDERVPAVAEHIKTQLARAGLVPSDDELEAVARLEVGLAKHSLPFELAEFPSPETEHPTALADLAPEIEWDGYFQRVGAAPPGPINVKAPAYLREFGRLFASTPPPTIRLYLSWKVAAALHRELPPRGPDRESACRLAMLRAHGVELSRQFAMAALGPAAQAEARAVAETVQRQVADAISANRWLATKARQRTAKKITATDVKVGFPNAWPSTGSAPMSRNHWDNVQRARAFEQRRAWDRANRPRSRSDWEMTVRPNEAWGMAAARLTIVNGYPDAFTNSIVLPAASLQPPMFDSAAPPEVNYATFGTLVAHELIHVAENYFFDEGGRAREIWSARDVAQQAKRAECIVAHASEAGLDGERTKEENIADLGGIRFAYDAMAKAAGDRLQSVGSDGLTGQQRFFVAYAQRWCAKSTQEHAAKSLKEDYHAPPRYRVNGILANVPEFAEAFSCPAVSAATCHVW